MLYATYLAFVIYLTLKTRSNVYSPTAKVEYLLKTHQKLTEDLDLYFQNEEKRLYFLRRYLDIFEKEQDKAMKDIPTYVGNPINAFTLIKRLTSDIHYIKTYIKNGSSDAKSIGMHNKNVKYPEKEDLIGAATALNRFQKVYNVDIKELAQGKVNGIVYSSPMTACDCYGLGHAFFDTGDFNNSIAWMFEALRKNKEEEQHIPHCTTCIIEYIRLGYDKLGDLINAQQWIQKTLVLFPSNGRAQQIAIEYRNRIENEKALMLAANVSIGSTAVDAESSLSTSQMKNAALFRCPETRLDLCPVVKSNKTGLPNIKIEKLNILQQVSYGLNHTMYFLLFFNICGVTWHMTYAEFFTALAEFESLLHVQKRLIDDLDLYVDVQEKKLFVMKGYLDLYSREQITVMKDISKYIRNPINAYILIKRLVSDVNYLTRIVSKGSEYVSNIIVEDEKMVYPDRQDLIGAAEALGRLQKTYNLDVKDLANGNLNNIAYSSPMTASDCFELGQALLTESNYLESGRAWMLEALRKYRMLNILYSFTEADIIKYISHVNHILASTENYSDNEAEENTEESSNTEEESTLKDHSEEGILSREKFAYYEELCRGKFELPVTLSSRLTCRYLTENHPFLKIAPIKLEMLYLSPNFLLFHDIITDNEIENIKKIGRPLLERAEAVNDENNENDIVHYRISKLAWLYDDDSDLIARITQRVSDMTGLSIESSEPLQVVNYGIGGHYEPHLDFDKKLENVSSFEDERVATILFYMTDVEQGGATVFPELGLTLYPKKGTAVFWFNLHPSGSGDFATRHAACPVLQGDKWVSTKWIHQYGQELVRPCNLKHDKHTINKKFYTVQK